MTIYLLKQMLLENEITKHEYAELEYNLSGLCMMPPNSVFREIIEEEED